MDPCHEDKLGFEEWKNGRMEEWKNGRMEEIMSETLKESILLMKRQVKLNDKWNRQPDADYHCKCDELADSMTDLIKRIEGKND